ncbi:hypothetical protein ACH4VR_28990 [Streptomyces sp. NPDC020883]|uniref:hypothetical protein n=1 Tax=Streptomyces sp. NPDC020883 TaxID=3365099 RepID=UPI003796D544
MHHPTRRTRRHSAGPRPDGRSPLQVLEGSFLALATAVEPLTLPAYLVCEEPEHTVLPVDQIRTRLAHPGTSPVLRERTWREVIRRAQHLGAPWDTVAVAMTIPVLHRMLARLGCPANLERAELEQEALAAVTAALPAVDVHVADAGRELFAAADRAVHRLVYAARRRAQRETGPQMAHLGRLTRTAEQASSAAEFAGVKGGEERNEYAVLARAVRARVLDISEAQLIAVRAWTMSPCNAWLPSVE